MIFNRLQSAITKKALDVTPERAQRSRRTTMRAHKNSRDRRTVMGEVVE
jgi:hypothetical protein